MLKLYQNLNLFGNETDLPTCYQVILMFSLNILMTLEEQIWSNIILILVTTNQFIKDVDVSHEVKLT